MTLSRIERAKRQLQRVKFVVTEDKCHIPNRLPNLHGYINTNFEYKQTKLHRLSAFVYLGLNIDDEKQLVLYKLECTSRACFNHEHLYIGNHSQNTLDAVKANTHGESKKLLCPRGHEYDLFRYKKGKLVARKCSQCRKIYGW